MKVSNGQPEHMRMMMSKEQPEAMQLPTLPFAVFDEFGQPCEDRVRDHFAAAFEALRAQIGRGEPAAFMSSKQLPALKDPEDEGGKYMPPRKTKLGNFDLPLYTHPAPQQIGQGVPDGWQLVPKEPTDAMVRAALHLDLSYMPGHDGPDRAAVYKAMLASTPPAPQQKPLTDEQITAGAKALCKRSSEICGVNADDNWNLESEYFKDDARCVLEAAHNIGEKK